MTNKLFYSVFQMMWKRKKTRQRSTTILNYVRPIISLLLKSLLILKFQKEMWISHSTITYSIFLSYCISPFTLCYCLNIT